MAIAELTLVFNGVKLARPGKIHTATRSGTANCYEPKRQVIRRFEALDGII